MRIEFQNRINKLPKNMIYYFDESGFDINSSNEYGYAKIGQRDLRGCKGLSNIV